MRTRDGASAEFPRIFTLRTGIDNIDWRNQREKTGLVLVSVPYILRHQIKFKDKREDDTIRTVWNACWDEPAPLITSLAAMFAFCCLFCFCPSAENDPQLSRGRDENETRDAFRDAVDVDAVSQDGSWRVIFGRFVLRSSHTYKGHSAWHRCPSWWSGWPRRGGWDDCRLLGSGHVATCRSSPGLCRRLWWCSTVDRRAGPRAEWSWLLRRL